LIVADWLFDCALGALLLILAAAVLHARQLYTSVVLFIAFGLLLALTWARLDATDLALAEAAIGAGLTGALLLSAMARTGDNTGDDTVGPLRKAGMSGMSAKSGISGRFDMPTQRLWPATLLALLVGIALLRGLWPLPVGPVVLPELALEQVPDAGVEHPVTAVLLNFRSWDTLLELMVLLLALLGVRQLQLPTQDIAPPWSILLAWSRLLAPLTLVVGGYVLWRGAFAPGGAFQAGALLAAGAVILRLTHLLPPVRWDNWLVRTLVLIGLVVFLVVALVAYVLAGASQARAWLAYPVAQAGVLILIIEVAATLSIATTLTLLVVGEKEALRA
jgi:multisubunit Na+/H+ antiporter MnhB subunit